MTTGTPHLNGITWFVSLLVLVLLVPLATVAALATSASQPAPWDRPEFDLGDMAGNAAMTAAVRKNDPLAIEAAFPRESYRPGSTATMRFWKGLDARVTVQILKVGPSRVRTLGDMEMRGLPMTQPTTIGRVRSGSTTRVQIGATWRSGLYFARLRAPHGRIGYAPFVVSPTTPGPSRVAVVMPTKTWQAYNYYDDDRDGYGDTWYATAGHTTARLDRPYLNRGVPPHFRMYDLYFLEWLHKTGKRYDILSQAELDAVRDPATLRKAYDLLIFPGHHEYVTTAEYSAVEGFRDLGGSLMFLSANNFFWRIDLDGRVITRVAQWRDLGRPESALLGVQYIANDSGESRGPWLVRRAPETSWLFEGARTKRFPAFSNAGIEIDHTTSSSPDGTQVVAEIPSLMGEGLTAQMTWYETKNGARVFAAGAFTLAGSIRQAPVARLVDNVIARITSGAA